MLGLPPATRHRDFRLLWLAQATSLIGNRLVTVALALYITDLTGSATDLGIVLAAGAVPMVGLLLIGGVWADRLPRHRVMVVTDLTCFGLHALLALLVATGTATIWAIAVIEALFGASQAFFRPASTGLLPQTVPEEEVQEANALIQLVYNLSAFIGPALATLIVVSAGFATAFAFDAATFLVSAALLIRMRPRTRLASAAAKVASDQRTSTWEALREGYREVRSRQWVWVTLSGFCVAVFVCLAPAYVLSPAVADEHYGGAAIYGIVAAALGVGTIAGSLTAIRWRPRHPMRLAAIGALSWPPSELLFAVGAPLPLVLTLCVVAGIGLALFEVWWQTALAERIPPDRLSRVSSYDWTISLGLLPLGYLLAGPVSDALSPSEALAWGAAVGTIALAMPLLSPAVRRLERIERPGGEPPSGEMAVPIP